MINKRKIKLFPLPDNSILRTWFVVRRTAFLTIAVFLPLSATVSSYKNFNVLFAIFTWIKYKSRI